MKTNIVGRRGFISLEEYLVNYEEEFKKFKLITVDNTVKLKFGPVDVILGHDYLERLESMGGLILKTRDSLILIKLRKDTITAAEDIIAESKNWIMVPGEILENIYENNVIDNNQCFIIDFPYFDNSDLIEDESNNRVVLSEKLDNKIYLVSVFESIDGALDLMVRPFGWYATFEKAEHTVVNNITNIHEYTYDYAVIEEIEEGLYPTECKKVYYKYNKDTGKYEEIPEPDKLKEITSFTIG